jgi:hypothetical protein
VLKFLNAGVQASRGSKKRNTRQPAATAAPKVNVQEGWNGRAGIRAILKSLGSGIAG